MRLLIVEDEKQICDMVAKSLYAAGYEVDTCYDGKAALECILSENYDLIVLDLNLPGMDGMELLKELRKYNDETKVLILSARGQIADKVEGLDAGATNQMKYISAYRTISGMSLQMNFRFRCTIIRPTIKETV